METRRGERKRSGDFSHGNVSERGSDNGDSGYSVWDVVWRGVVCQISWHKTLKYLAQLQDSTVSVKQCFILNGTLFLGSILLFDNVLTPLLAIIGEELARFDNALMSEASPASPESEAQLLARDLQWAAMRTFVRNGSSRLFTLLWLAPLYLISILLNAVFNIDIAKQVYTMVKGRPAREFKSIVTLLRDSMYNYMLMLWVTIFCWGVYHIRLIGAPISIIWTSWAISFYAYDFVWTLRGWDFQKRLLVFQRHWLFMLGFGLPSALITFIMPQFLGYSVYALAFPVSIILAVISEPVQHRNPGGLTPRSLRVFVFAEYINLLCFRLAGIVKSAARR